MSVPPPTPAQLRAGQVAGVLVGVEAAVVVGFALFYLFGLLSGRGSDPVVVIMSIVLMLVFVVALGYVALGLWTRHPRAQAPAIAANGLLVPLGIATFQFAPFWAAGGLLLMAVAVITATIRMGQLD